MRDTVDLHTHTIASGHAYNTIYEMAQSAAEKGVELLGISDHGPAMEGSASKHYFRSSRCVPRELFGVRILFGCELNLMSLDGEVDLDAKFSAPLDYAIVSMHDVCIASGSAQENTRAYRLAMENPAVCVIGHPDDGTFPVDFDELARAAVEARVLLELNEASVRPGSYRKNGPENAAKMLECCEKYGTKILLSSDAHVAVDILRHASAWELVQRMRFPEELIVNGSAETALAALAARKALCASD